MRRALATIAAITVSVVLGGCSLLTSLPLPGVPHPSSSAGPLAVGSCLDAMHDRDSDRRALVDCAEPHLFEVTAIDEWPGMEAALDGKDAGDVWDDIHLLGGADSSAEYQGWASHACDEAAQQAVGIADVEVEGHTASDLWLRVGGTYGVDLSLGSRTEFVAGDHTTVCSMAWYDDSGPRLLDGPAFDKLLHPGFDLDRRECWSGDYSSIPCDQPHAAQVMLAFDGLPAFGPEFIERAATGVATEEDWALEDAFCEQLMLQTLPSTADLGELGYLADISAGYAWDAYSGTVDPLGGYFYACVAVGPGVDDMLTGDVFDGTAAIDTADVNA